LRVEFYAPGIDDAGTEYLTRNRGARGNAKCEIVIGLVNIMPLSALRTTEALFRRRLNSVASLHNIHLRLFAPPHIAGTIEVAGAGKIYESLDDLWSPVGDGPAVDALIVTGTEPEARLLEDEPVWPYLTKLCDWAAEHTISTIWSCFSAHAAVLHIDGIRRRRLEEKRSGIFQYQKATEHFLVEDLPAQFPMPHSRYHDLVGSELRARHYQILSHSPHAGVDGFTKQHGKSQFLFLQGHPEYSPHILLGEYCRDVKRFLSGERTDCPRPPENYLDPATIAAFPALGNGDKPLPHGQWLQEFTKSAIGKLGHSWNEPAQLLYAAWLGDIAGQKFFNRTHPLARPNNAASA
jgi:homoserine O-succinyltransferase